MQCKTFTLIRINLHCCIVTLLLSRTSEYFFYLCVTQTECFWEMQYSQPRWLWAPSSLMVPQRGTFCPPRQERTGPGKGTVGEDQTLRREEVFPRSRTTENRKVQVSDKQARKIVVLKRTSMRALFFVSFYLVVKPIKEQQMVKMALKIFKSMLRNIIMWSHSIWKHMT